MPKYEASQDLISINPAILKYGQPMTVDEVVEELNTSADGWQPIETAPRDGRFELWQTTLKHPIVVQYYEDVDVFVELFTGEAEITREDLVKFFTHWRRITGPEGE